MVSARQWLGALGSVPFGGDVLEGISPGDGKCDEDDVSLAVC